MASLRRAVALSTESTKPKPKQACSLPYRQSVLAVEFLGPDFANAPFPTDQMPEVDQLLISFCDLCFKL